MALRRKGNETAKTQEKVQNAASVQDEKAQPQEGKRANAKPVEDASVPATTTAAAAPAVNTGPPQIALEDARNVMIMEFGTLPRLKAEQGTVVDQDENELGNWVEIEVYSFNSRYTITPNDKDASTELVKFSLDGVELDDGSGILVADYLRELKEDGWSKAEAREYYEIVGPLLACEGKSNYIEDVVQIQCSPTSRKSFDAHRMQMTFKIARGKAPAGSEKFVRFTATAKKSGNNKWTQFVCGLAKEAV